MDLAEEVRALREDVKSLSQNLEGLGKPKLMNTAQAAAFLGKSPDILYEWRRDQKGPPYLHISSRSIMYDRDDLIAWVQQHKVAA